MDCLEQERNWTYALWHLALTFQQQLTAVLIYPSKISKQKRNDSYFSTLIVYPGAGIFQSYCIGAKESILNICREQI